ncbi:ribose-5-phosphate isomerase RpiA [Halobaculum limi]|uniref:ribose-5-phosphate isomerase RpiA n=1 Tax=Halobaculum limi TaxID=3031916 RepID=UPI002406A5CB|nr:ribose-5-phosphate isomerase RpiA [Halobaculum sp. YSMS11]
MKNTGGGETAKRAAGEAAAAEVSDGDLVGLGTGSTAAHAIRTLGDRVADGLDVEGVATSYQSRALAKDVGIPLRSLSDVARVDVAIDGADQVATDANALVKGGGAAHAREKVVASAADRFLVVADDSKLAAPLDYPVPVEVLPDAHARVERALRDVGGDPVLREAERKDGPVITDNGNLVVDCDFGGVDDPASLATALSGVAGVVEHGLFVGLADAVYVGDADGAVAVRSLK